MATDQGVGGSNPLTHVEKSLEKLMFSRLFSCYKKIAVCLENIFWRMITYLLFSGSVFQINFQWGSITDHLVFQEDETDKGYSLGTKLTEMRISCSVSFDSDW